MVHLYLIIVRDETVEIVMRLGITILSYAESLHIEKFMFQLTELTHINLLD